MRSRTYALAVLLALVASACATAKDTGFPPIPKTTEASPSPSATATGPVAFTGPIDVKGGNVFDPKEATVKVGTTVVWEQSDTAQPHTVTSDDNKLFDSHPDCKNFTDPCMQAGDEFRFIFKKAGEYGYYCKLHGAPGGIGMAGTITVEA